MFGKKRKGGNMNTNNEFFPQMPPQPAHIEEGEGNL